MKTSPLVRLVIDAIEDIKGLDVKLLDVTALTTITDHMVICTGTSNRHVKSIAENIVVEAKKAGYRPLGVEGMDAAEWVLVDLGDIVAHVMQSQTRLFYQLEKLWDIAPVPLPSTPKPPKPPKAGKAKAGKAKPRSKGGKTRRPAKTRRR